MNMARQIISNSLGSCGSFDITLSKLNRSCQHNHLEMKMQHLLLHNNNNNNNKMQKL